MNSVKSLDRSKECGNTKLGAGTQNEEHSMQFCMMNDFWWSQHTTITSQSLIIPTLILAIEDRLWVTQRPVNIMHGAGRYSGKAMYMGYTAFLPDAWLCT